MDVLYLVVLLLIGVIAIASAAYAMLLGYQIMSDMRRLRYLVRTRYDKGGPGCSEHPRSRRRRLRRSMELASWQRTSRSARS